VLFSFDAYVSWNGVRHEVVGANLIALDDSGSATPVTPTNLSKRQTLRHLIEPLRSHLLIDTDKLTGHGDFLFRCFFGELH
jgi:hypothetical protein